MTALIGLLVKSIGYNIIHIQNEMPTLIGLLVLSIFIFKSLEILNDKSNMRGIKILSLFFIAVFFYFNTLISNLFFFFFVFVFLIFVKFKTRLVYPINIYVLFLFYCCFTLFYSESYWYGSLMILKLVLPFLFLMVGYSLIDTKDKFRTFLLKSQKYFIPFAILSTAPFVNLFKPYIKILATYEAGNAELFVTLQCISLALFFLTKEKQYLIKFVILSLPYVTLIRRTCMGAGAIVFGVAYYFKKGYKAVLPIVLMIVLSIGVIVSVPSLKERFFGGDKGDVSGLSTTELLSVDNIGTSGRSYMWQYVTEKFYHGNEFFGCGLGTMKEYLRNNVQDETAHFEMLHNDHLHLLIETGLLGVLIYSTFFIVVIFMALSIMRKRSVDITLRVAAFCALSTTLSLLFCMFFSNMLSKLTPIAITFLFIGIFLRLKKNA